MTEPESTGPGGRPGSNRDIPGGGRLQRGFEHGLSLAQLTVLLPVVVLLLSAIGAFIYGTVVVVHFVVDIAHEPFAVHNLRLFLTEIDLFLIGATLMIAAFGFYELFVSKVGAAGGRRPLALPAWLEMTDLDDLKARVISMIILVTAVSFTDVVLEFGHETLDVLYLGAGVAVFIGSLTVYLRFGSGRNRD
jgi:uncharacterized membrane protein YqhA